MANESTKIGGWPKARLGSVVQNFDSRRVPLSSRERQQRQGEIPYYGAAGCIDHVDSYLFEGVHLLVGEDGSVVKVDGTPFLQLVTGKFWVNNHAHVLRGSDEIDTKYVYYALGGSNITGLVTGAVQPKLTQANLNSIQLPFPDRASRESVVKVLEALDDKIELNRRMNVTLEAMARALFQSWFVDFDPVRANAGGRPPAGLDAPTAALFPDQFQNSELGEIPKGWAVQPLGNLLDTLETGRRPKGGVGSYKHGVPSVGAESIYRVGDYDYGKTKFIPDDFFSSMKSGKVQSYDVLLYKDGGKPGVFLPRVSMFGEGFPFETYAINEHVFRLRSAVIGQPLLYFQLGSERLLTDLHNRGGKAAIPGINQTDVRTLQVILPSPSVADAFNYTCYPLLKTILYNAKQSRTLATLRDTLLPKLLSGELSTALSAMMPEPQGSPPPVPA